MDLINPGVARKPNGKPYPFRVRCIGGSADIMGGFDTLEEAQRVASSYQNQPRPGSKTPMQFVAEPHPLFEK